MVRTFGQVMGKTTRRAAVRPRTGVKTCSQAASVRMLLRRRSGKEGKVNEVPKAPLHKLKRSPHKLPHKVQHKLERKESDDDDDEGVFEIDCIRKEYDIGGVAYFIVKWTGFGDKHNTLEREDNLPRETVESFRQRL